MNCSTKRFRTPSQGSVVGKDTLDFGIDDAIAHFNIGCQANNKSLEKQGTEPKR